MHQGASWRGAAGCEGAFPRELAQAPAKIIGKFCILDSESREPSRALSLERQWHLCPLPFPSSQRQNATQPLQCNDQWQLLGTPPPMLGLVSGGQGWVSPSLSSTGPGSCR